MVSDPPAMKEWFVLQFLHVQPLSLGCEMFSFFFQAEDGIRDYKVTGVQTCALPIYGIEDLPHHGDRGRGEGGLRTLERGPPLGGIELMPVEDAYHASIFSTGNTRSALAPACFSRSSVSQKTFSRHTACTATRSGEPSSGMMVGDSDPGRSRAISGSALRGACSMMYLLSRTCCTPSMRISSRCTHSCFAAGRSSGVRMSTA